MWVFEIADPSNHEMMPGPPPHTIFHHITEEHSRPECVVKSGQTLEENGFCVGFDLGLHRTMSPNVCDLGRRVGSGHTNLCSRTKTHVSLF